nr:replication initiation protein [Corynebacterium jeddahense]
MSVIAGNFTTYAGWFAINACVKRARRSDNLAGINRLSGKARCLWLIDPVYANESGTSQNLELLAATRRTLVGFLD